MVQVFSGSIECHSDDQMVIVRAGQAILLKPGAREFFQFDREQSTTHGFATWNFFEEKWNTQTILKEIPFHLQVLEMSELYIKTFRLGLDYVMQGDSATQVNAVFTILLEEHLKANRPQTLPRVVLSAQELIKREAQHLSASGLAAKVHTSLSHLNRLFAQHLAHTPSDLIWKRRAEMAAEYLKQSGHSIESIAEMCGYKTASHFCKKFKGHYSLSPFQYRKKKWSETNAKVSHVDRV